MTDADERLQRGIVFKIQRLSTEGGPGLRTAIGFKGCPMSCRWCQNPEGIAYRPELIYYTARCIACGDCVDACPNKALTLDEAGLHVQRALCQTCETCVHACPTGALEVIGRPYTVEALLELIRRDKIFYEHSGGGATFSGGEAASQVSFLRTLANRCKSEHIHTTLETCLIHEWSVYRALLPYIDLWLVSLKLMDARLYKAGTGRGIWHILETARLLASTRARMWVRTPIISGWSDTETNVRAIGEFIREQLPSVERWELQAFSRPPGSHYRTLGQVFDPDEIPMVRQERLVELSELARSICGRRVPVVTLGQTAI